MFNSKDPNVPGTHNVMSSMKGLVRATAKPPIPVEPVRTITILRATGGHHHKRAPVQGIKTKWLSWELWSIIKRWKVLKTSVVICWQQLMGAPWKRWCFLGPDAESTGKKLVHWNWQLKTSAHRANYQELDARYHHANHVLLNDLPLQMEQQLLSTCLKKINLIGFLQLHIHY